jgi:hypothetical protein
MPIRNNLLSDIENALGALSSSNLNSLSTIDNLYEVYLLTLILRAAINEGGTYSLRNINGGSSLYFRTAPGYIASNAQNYTYSEISFPQKPVLEAHVGIRCTGPSTVLHESDICVLYKTEADLCRQSRDRVAPRSSKIVISVEAKYYTSPLGLHLGRAFLGLIADFSADNSIFVTNSSSESIEKLLSHKSKMWEHNITPNQINDVNRLIHSFQTAFKDFKAKH